MIDTFENRAALQTPASLAEAMRDGKILEAKAVMCDSKHNLIVDLKFMRGLIPREEGALGIKDGTVRDIAILSRVNRPVCFLVEDFTRDEYGRITALLSRRAAQEKCREEFVRRLSPGDVINARITHIEPFGVFADIGCGIVSLLPIDSISVSRIEHPRERFMVGMDIRAVVKCRESARVTLSHKELLGTWEENAARFRPGETVGGIIRSIESYGVFVELAPNLAGLAEVKENIYPGQQASVFIKSILPARMKVKLILIETFDPEPKRPQPPEYFFTGDHMDQFVYSPPQSDKYTLPPALPSDSKTALPRSFPGQGGFLFYGLFSGRRGGFRRLEGELPFGVAAAVGLVGCDGAFQHLLGDGVLHLVLNHPAERTAAVGGVVALVGHSLHGSVGELHLDVHVMQLLLQGGEHLPGDFLGVLLGELVEHDDVVHTVEEFPAGTGLSARP